VFTEDGSGLVAGVAEDQPERLAVRLRDPFRRKLEPRRRGVDGRLRDRLRERLCQPDELVRPTRKRRRGAVGALRAVAGRKVEAAGRSDGSRGGDSADRALQQVASRSLHTSRTNGAGINATRRGD